MEVAMSGEGSTVLTNAMSIAADLEPVSALMQVLAERWVMTLALADGPAPYPTPLFYALVEPDAIARHAAPLLLFVSDPHSHHGRLAGTGPTPAGAAVYLESETVGELRGAQLRGSLIRDDALSSSAAEAARARYLARHRVAAPMLERGHHLYALIVTWAKLTDNRLGFGVHPQLEFPSAWSGCRVQSAT
jgi:uncharacterized protein YhbP (UPF0306 family)